MYSAYVERTKKRAPAAEPKKKFRMGDDADELPEDERFDGSFPPLHHSTTFLTSRELYTADDDSIHRTTTYVRHSLHIVTTTEATHYYYHIYIYIYFY